MHELDTVVTAIMVPVHAPPWGEFVDASVADPDVLLAGKLLANLDDLLLQM